MTAQLKVKYRFNVSIDTNAGINIFCFKWTLLTGQDLITELIGQMYCCRVREGADLDNQTHAGQCKKKNLFFYVLKSSKIKNHLLFLLSRHFSISSANRLQQTLIIIIILKD